ncbi:MAG: hypothetical protein ACLUES_11615 [Flavonifractor plautii]
MMTSKKAPGFYAGMLACVLAIAAAVCYGVVFPGIESTAGMTSASRIRRPPAFSPPLLREGEPVPRPRPLVPGQRRDPDAVYQYASGLFQIPFTASSPSQITQLVVCAARLPPLWWWARSRSI